MRPILEHDVCDDGPQVLEEPISGTFCGDRRAPGGDGQGCNGVISKCQQVQDHQHAGQRVLAVAEIVLEVVATALEDIERLVLDLPSRPSAGG
jgi:hypothetical protein